MNGNSEAKEGFQASIRSYCFEGKSIIYAAAPSVNRIPPCQSHAGILK